MYLDVTEIFIMKFVENTIKHSSKLEGFERDLTV